MTDRPRLPDLDRSHEDDGPRGAARRVVFGKRLRAPERDVSFRRERLRIVAAELNLLLAYEIEAATCFAELVEDGEPAVVLGRSIGLKLSVEIEAASGLFVLCEQMSLPGGGVSDCVLITSREERLIDQIVGIVSAQTGELAPRTADAAIDLLVGRSLAEVERRLVLRTLFHFKGDRRQTAFALGIDEAMLRAKLRRYLMEKKSETASPEVPQ